MFKRMILALTFLAAFTAAGIVPTKNAEAWRYGGRPYAARYYAPRVYYRDFVPYRTYYRPYYAPRVYDPYYYDAYYGYPNYYYGPRSGVVVSFGF